MAKKTRSISWQKNILLLMDKAPLRAFTPAALRAYLQSEWHILEAPPSLTTGRAIDFLRRTGDLTLEEIGPAPDARDKEGTPYRAKERYGWKNPGPYSISLSLRGRSYFTHASAAFLNNLSVELPATIYVNREQTAKPEATVTDQAAIDRALAREPRVSRYAFKYKDSRIVLLSGKQTNRLEVTQEIQPTGEIYDLTKVERTLIDCAVRPQYAGGLPHVLEIYRNARERVSTNVLVRTLERLNYAYPYHQSIGFLMERAGYKPSQYAKLRELGLQFDFYLAHAMTDPAYDKSWHLYYPTGLQPRD